MGDLSAHFSKREFRCVAHGQPCPHCGGQVKVSPALLDALETIREYTGIPIIITSGFRCPKRNAELPNSSPQSAHLDGEAADFLVDGNRARFAFLEAIVHYGPTRYGIGRDFIHIDVSRKLPQEVAWGYWSE